MVNNFTDVLPFRINAPHDEIALYSFDRATGMGGRFVVLCTGQNAPQDGLGDFAASTPGYNYQGLTNVRSENRRKFMLAPSGSAKHQVFGMVLYGTIENDTNDLKLLFNPHRKHELMVVVSGETNNILCDGVVRLRSTAYSGIPIPGHVAVISPYGDGKLQIVDPTLLSPTGSLTNGAWAPGYHHIVAKVISSSGTAASYGPGYADFQLCLK